MKIVVLLRDIVWAQPAENCRRCSEAIDRNLGADLYVLPEMFSTGFCTNPEGIAETIEWFRHNLSSYKTDIYNI